MMTLVFTLWLGLGAWAQEPVAAPEPTPVPTVTEAEALAPLEAAYQKEYAYLSAERDGLQRRIAASAEEGRKARAAADTELESLEARLTALQVQAEQAELQLADVDRRAGSALEADDALRATLFQAANSLGEDAGDEPDGLEGIASALTGWYRAAATRVREGAAVRATDGVWFADDGARHEGTVLEVGEIATFGVDASGAVALLPGGEDRLIAARDGLGQTGAALAAGTSSSMMSLYLHEGRTQRLQERAPKTLGDVLEAGGAVGYVILVLGALALVLAVGRVVVLYRAAGGYRRAEAAISAALSGRAGEAAAMLTGEGSSERVVRRLIGHLDDPGVKLDDRLDEALLTEQPRLDRFGTAILVVAAVAPLLGLLGTVTGMIATFDIITEMGTGDPRNLSGGISAALVTTQFGLIVAIPALLAGNLLAAWSETVAIRAEGLGLRLVSGAAEPPDDASTPEGPALAVGK